MYGIFYLQDLGLEVFGIRGFYIIWSTTHKIYKIIFKEITALP
jgi:hypothetical protein